MTLETLFRLRGPMQKIASAYGWCFAMISGETITVIAPTLGYWDIYYMNDNEKRA